MSIIFLRLLVCSMVAGKTYVQAKDWKPLYMLSSCLIYGHSVNEKERSD
jgi:hypothetical protein